MNEDELQQFLSASSRRATRNEIRELLKLTARPEIISLAGGMPSPEAFPIGDLVELIPALLQRYGTSALQYGLTEGDLDLRRELIRLMMETEGTAFARLTPEHVLVTSASQQGLDLCGRVFITPGDVLLCGLPTYLGALGAFTACGARLSGIPLDDEGLRTDLLEQRLLDLRRRGVRPKLLYTVPDFQNPTGVTLSLKRRREMLAIAREYNLLILEDSPFRQLRYVGDSKPSLASLDRGGRVISLFTFSKILSPGLRLGWIVAAPAIISRLTIAKQSLDLCTSGLSQLVVREYLKADRLSAQIERIRELYSVNREAMLAALANHIDPSWNVSWTHPEGGLFLWMTLPTWMNADTLLERALEQKLAFVVGRAFHCDGSGQNTLRLNFSYPSIQQLDTAAKRLARCIGSMVRERAHSRHEAPVPQHSSVA
jgi:2-aminoadipate transaminase